MTSPVAELLKEQREAFDSFIDNVNINEVEGFQRYILETSRQGGTTIMTGVGKSSLVARLLSDLFVSIGIRSTFLDPLNALHGDIGCVHDNDVVVAISKSGETQELLNMVPYVRARKARWISWVSASSSSLGSVSDFVVHIPLLCEVGKWGVVPATSMLLQVTLGSTMAVSCLAKSGLTIEEYARNHPAGSIGKRLTLEVGDVMESDHETIPLCSSKSTVMEAVKNMNRGLLIVTSEGMDGARMLYGLFTDGDFRRHVARCASNTSDALTMSIGDICTRSPRICNPGDLAFTVYEDMKLHKDQARPVVLSGGEVAGLIDSRTLRDSGM